MQEIAKDTIGSWQQEGRQTIPQNFEEFRNLVVKARDLVERGKYHMAAVYCEMAANYASCQGCGLWVSSDIEQILFKIGQKAIPARAKLEQSRAVATSKPKKILHVATAMASIGGHSRMLWRWLQQDPDRCHSLVLTRQFPKPIPQALSQAIKDRHGKIYQLNRNPGNIIDWAKQLREIAADADLVVLHVNGADVIPTIAFANKEFSPPICFLDHADHLFWLGASISDVVISLRESGMKLAQSRRTIESNRNFLLPIVLEPIQRNLPRDVAKQQLGISKDSVLLLSIARAVKYKKMDGISFADAHISLLKQYEQAILIVVGPGDREDWASAIEQTQGRLKVLCETEHTAVFYQAADIYVDSFPFVSNTSLLEAGSYGTPLVSRYPYPSESSAILGADMPGLTGNLLRVNTLEEYTKILSKLIEDSEFRQSLGVATSGKIADTHWGDGWQQSLEKFYSYASTIPKINIPMNFADKMLLEDLDCLISRVHSMDISDDKLMQWHLPLMPFPDRLYHWLVIFKKRGLRNNPINLLMSEWTRSPYYAAQASLKSFLDSRKSKSA